MNNKDELIEAAVGQARRSWRHLCQRFDPDGVRFDPTPDRVMDGVVDGIAVMMWIGEAQALGEQLDVLIKETERDPWMFDNLVKVAGQMLQEDLLKPESLKLFAVEILVGKRRRPARRGRSSDPRLQHRDILLFLLVQQAVEIFKTAAYSTARTQRSPTAADIVAEALKREGEDISIDTIIKAYKRHKR